MPRRLEPGYYWVRYRPGAGKPWGPTVGLFDGLAWALLNVLDWSHAGIPTRDVVVGKYLGATPATLPR